MMPAWQSIPGETPIDPSGLKIRGITTRKELNVVEAENIRKAVVKYLAARPAEKTALARSIALIVPGRLLRISREVRLFAAKLQKPQAGRR